MLQLVLLYLQYSKLISFELYGDTTMLQLVLYLQYSKLISFELYGDTTMLQLVLLYLLVQQTY